MSTLLDIGKEIARRAKAPKPVPSSIANSEGSESLFQAINDAGKLMLKQHDWSVLQVEQTITLVQGQESYPLPADFDRFIPYTGWDQTNLRMMVGSQSAQRWQWGNNVTVTLSQFRRWFRIQATSGKNGVIRIFPTPEADGDVLVYEYISRNWAQDSMGTAKASMTSDTDTPRLDDDLVSWGGTWLFKQSEGLAYLDDRNDWERMFLDIAGGDAPPQIAWSNCDPVWRRGTFNWRAAWPCNVPDGGYGM